jgi:exosortase
MDHIGTDVHKKESQIFRSVSFAFIVALTLAIAWAPLTMLLRFSFREEQYSHIALIPLISASLFYLERGRIFSRLATQWPAGFGLLSAGTLLYWFGRHHSTSWSENDRLASAVFPVVLIWIGGFVLSYGLRASQAGLFPLLFLFLMVPIPDVLLSRAIYWLQIGSAEVTDALFQGVDVPVFRTALVFALPGLTIEIAEECSGIRSSLALVITSLLAGQLLLRSVWRKAALAVATLPLLVIKNGIRIVTLSLLAIYVDPSYLTGWLHRQGGIVFLLLALALLLPVLWWLRRSERIADGTPADAVGARQAPRQPRNPVPPRGWRR